MATGKKTVIVIAGPTAVGKTAVAIAVAKHFNTEIISADSRQCYKELNIGVARPSVDELKMVPHYFIASHSIHEKVNAAAFEKYALEKAAMIFEQHDVLVMVGGTGLYLKAFMEGLDDIPEVPTEVHDRVVEEYTKNGMTWLQQQVEKFDPLFFDIGETKNPQRLMRALEVFRATGKSIISFRKGEKTWRDFDVIKIALEIPKQQLHENINHRVDGMMEHGLAEEVRTLLPYQQLNALQTVGYKELFGHFNGQLSIAEAVELIKKNTRHYAKRQLTWFRKDKEYYWMNPVPGAVISYITEQLAIAH